MKRLTKNVLLTILSSSMLLSFASCSNLTETKPSDGLNEKDGNVLYYQNGQMVTGFKDIDGDTYLFSDDTGYMTKGWYEKDGKKYYFDENGKMMKGSCNVEGVDYNFSNEGVLFTGWKTEGDNKYYFYEADTADHKCGEMALGVQTVDGKTYYFYDVKSENAKRPLGSVLKNNRIVANHNLYCFDAEGVCIRTVDGTKPMVALTYDDGPSKFTKTILDVLEENHAIATFFVVGDRVSSYKESLTREYELGNQIASHTYEHKYLTKLNATDIKFQMDKADDEIFDIIKIRTKIMRPPGGKIDDKVSANVGKPMILWSLDTEDWKSRDSVSVQNVVFNHIKDGDIVLMHDLYESTADASKVIIPGLINKGYQLVTVEELALLRGVHMEAGGTYRQFYPSSN